MVCMHARVCALACASVCVRYECARATLYNLLCIRLVSVSFLADSCCQSPQISEYERAIIVLHN